jgi:predicted DNA-binding transcriptional regulator AlpA
MAPTRFIMWNEWSNLNGSDGLPQPLDRGRPMRAPEVARLLGLSIRDVHAKVRPRYKLGQRTVVYYLHDVQQWADSRKESAA